MAASFVASRRGLAAVQDGAVRDNPGLALERSLSLLGDDMAARESEQRLRDKITEPMPAELALLYLKAYKRWRSCLNSLPGPVLTREVRTLDRVIVGLGSESVLETSITLNRIYGVPILPGSALKGVARSYYENELRPADPEERKKHRETGDDLFGWEAKEGEQGKEKEEAKSGCVTFFDAWYIPGSTKDDKPLRPDVITVHHPAYYQNSGQEPPTDFDDPTPVGFISARGSFLLAVQGPDEQWTNLAMEVLTRALAHYGVGGKTSSGYGRLVPSTTAQGPSSQSTTDRPQPAPDPLSDPEVEQVKTTPPNQVRSRIANWLQKFNQRCKTDVGKARALAEAIRERVEASGIADQLGMDQRNYRMMIEWLEAQGK
ncbi:MAG: hypothetical protein AMXMBFR61_08350 [Fimbriimonadales bacterium]